MGDKKIRVGIIGVGNMGSSHAKSMMAEGVCPDFVLTALADVKQERLDWAKTTFPDADIALFTDAEAMLDSGLIDACVVAVPHYDHTKYAIMCMERGIHVMVEKPAGVYTKQVREMNAVADKHPEVVFGMMFNQRTSPIYQKMRELVQSGQFGAIRRTNWIITDWYRPQAYYDSGDWRATWSGEGGGVLLNQCPHQLDLWQWICGMPISVRSELHYGKWHDIEVEDDVTTYVEYENGATGVFITTTGDAYGTNRFEIQFDKGKMVSEGGKLTVIEYDQDEPSFTKENTVPFGRMKSHPLEFDVDHKSTQHVGVFNAWGGAILRGEPMIADGREGINGLLLSNAMHLSSFKNCKIDLPFDEEEYYEELMKRVANSRRKTTATGAVTADMSSTF